MDFLYVFKDPIPIYSAKLSTFIYLIMLFSTSMFNSEILL